MTRGASRAHPLRGSPQARGARPVRFGPARVAGETAIRACPSCAARLFRLRESGDAGRPGRRPARDGGGGGTPPLAADRSVPGAILPDNQAFHPAIEVLAAEDFFLESHRRIFSRMIELSESSRPIDLITLHEGLERTGDLEAEAGARAPGGR